MKDEERAALQIPQGSRLQWVPYSTSLEYSDDSKFKFAAEFPDAPGVKDGNNPWLIR